MRKLIFLVAALAAFSTHFQAQEDEASIRARINQSASEMVSLQGSFTQVKHMSMLEEEMVSEGVIYYARENRLRWEYQSPYNYTFVLNGSSVVLGTEDKNDVIDVNQSKVFKEIARIMMNSVTGHCIDDGKDFQTSISTVNGEWVATLVPLNRNLRAMFTTLVLHYDRSQSAITTVELYEKNGDCTEIKLHNIRTNLPIDESVFNLP